MSENPELISQFTAITGVDEDRAKFYLESSAWKLDVIKNFEGNIASHYFYR